MILATEKRNAHLENKHVAVYAKLFGQNRRCVQCYRFGALRYFIWPKIADFTVNKNVFVSPRQTKVPTNFDKNRKESVFKVQHRLVKHHLDRSMTKALRCLDQIKRIRGANVT